MEIKINDIIGYIKKCEIAIGTYDFGMACIDNDFINELNKKFIENNMETIDIEELIKILEENKDKFNPEILLLAGLRNEDESLEKLHEIIQTTKKEIASARKKTNIEETALLIQMEEEYKKILKSVPQIRKKYHGMDVVYTKLAFGEENVPVLDILDSKIIIDQEKGRNKKKKNQLKDLEERISKIEVEDKTGMDLIFSSLFATDILSVFPTAKFRGELFKYRIYKSLWETGLRDKNEILEAGKDLKVFKEKCIGNGENAEIKRFAYPLLKEFIDYADIDRLVMMYAYRLIGFLESNDVSNKNTEAIRKILLEIQNYCEKNKIPDNYKLSFIGEDANIKSTEMLEFSTKHIKESLKRFQNGVYYNGEKLEEIRKKVSFGEIYLDEIPSYFLNFLFSNAEYGQILFSSDRNFKYLTEVFKIKKDDIKNIAIETGIDSIDKLRILINNNIIAPNDLTSMYVYNLLDKKILLEFLKKESATINYDDLVKGYPETINDKKKKEYYDKYIELCKDIVEQSISINPETPAEKIREEVSENIMEKLAENYELEKRELYIEQLEYLYKTGLIQIKSIVDWDDKAIVARFLKDKVIDSTIVKKLMTDKTISTEYAQGLLGECILDPEMDSETRLKYIKSGLISEDYIGKAYQELLIDSSQANELENEGYFERRKYDTLSKEELQEKAKIKLELGDISSLVKIRGEGGESRRNPYAHERRGMLIDPYAREKLFELLGAKRAISKEIQPGDPFYNYEFYVLPDKNGEYDLESVVIAERYFMNKDKPKTFATGNATYFFQWRDLLYISNLKKSEMARKSKDIVFKANHITSDGDNKEGCWGNSVITAIGKTMMGRTIRKYNKKALARIAQNKVKELYSAQNWTTIKNYADDIDLGQYIFKNAIVKSSDDNDPHDDGNR